MFKPAGSFLWRRAPSFLVLSAALAAVACAVVKRPPATIMSIHSAGQSARDDHRSTVSGLVEGLARRAVARGDRTLDVLMLSGGGQHGAYGIGFLRGWQSRSEGRMPRFDLVTGVSTGALQAPFALLGTEEALATCAALYRNAADEFAPTLDWWFWLRRTGGIVDVSRYKATVDKLFDEGMRGRLRAEFGADRHLAIATTDFDLGIGRIWDLGRELDDTAEGLRRTRALFVATSAIPGVFPPVVIDGHVHGDGGVVSNLLIPLEFADYRALAERLRALGVDGPVKVRLWVVMNVWTHAKVNVTNPASRGDISDRSNTLMFVTHQPQLLERLADLSLAVTGQVPGLQVEFHATAIPSSMSTEPGAAKLFDKAWMDRLERFGYDRARGDAAWDEITSPYQRPAP